MCLRGSQFDTQCYLVALGSCEPSSHAQGELESGESGESGACGLFGGLGMPRDRTECDKAQRQVLCGREAAGLLLNLSVAL